MHVISCTRKSLCVQVACNLSSPAMDYFFFFSIFQRSIFNLEKNKSILLRRIFGSTRTSNRIYLLRNSFSNYVYLKDMYITLKGIKKILFVSVLRILLIFKFLNFTAGSTKKRIRLSKICMQYSMSEVNFSLIHPTHINIYSL